MLAERVAGAGADLELGAAPTHATAARDHDVLILLEPMVLPSPGAIRTATALALRRPDTAITGKVLRADGRLDSAGGTVFFDRSVALDRRGHRRRARRRGTTTCGRCAGPPGLVAASGDAVGRGRPPDGPTGRAFVREWCAAVWARGGSVVYQPDLTAVRVDGQRRRAVDPAAGVGWQRVLDLRPRVPIDLGDGEWRYLLAHDDVEACRG